MYLYKFDESEVIVNTLTVYPSHDMYLYEQDVYIDRRPELSGAYANNVTMVSSSDISLFELNIDRPTGSQGYEDSPASLIYPYTIKDSTWVALKTITTSEYNSAEMGDELTGSYPMSASISIDHIPASAQGIGRRRITSLRTSLNYYTYLSPHYAYSSPINLGNKAEQEISLLSVPSIFYGSTLKKGSMNLRFYISGTLVAQLHDEARNGELVQVGPTGSEGSGSVAGVILYEEGCALLTGSWDLSTLHTEDYLGAGAVAPQWRYFGTNLSGTTGGTNISTPKSSWAVSFEGTNRIPSIMMMATAPKNQLIHSNNPTYLLEASKSVTSVVTSSTVYSEDVQLPIKNIASSSFLNYEKAFEKTTYISKVAIYDEKKNVIGVAKLANPVRKIANRSFTFKLKLDI